MKSRRVLYVVYFEFRKQHPTFDRLGFIHQIEPFLTVDELKNNV